MAGDPQTTSLFLGTFTSVFVAELGDKTQLATMALSSGSDSHAARVRIFVAAALALTLSSALGVFAGAFASKWISPLVLRRVGGVLFLVMGAWMLAKKA